MTAAVRMQVMRLAILLLLLSSFAAAQCDKSAWIIEDDGIAGVVLKEGKPVTHAVVNLSSTDRKYNAVTDADGRFSISPVPTGNYSFAVKGWGEQQLNVKAWRRGEINHPGFVFSKHKKCLLLVLVSN
jgi:hypothetical protein